jgi:hypothetical protein
MEMNETKYRRSAAANYLNSSWGIPCSTGHLANLAYQNLGPRYFLAGRFPIYLQAELDRWAQSRISEPQMRGKPLAGRETPNLMKGS